MNIKYYLKNNRLSAPLYQRLKEVKVNRVRSSRTAYHGKFIDRSSGFEQMCMVLAGYKEFLYPEVFGRLERFLPGKMDVCVITSGLYSRKIDKLCEKNQWSYLSTKENNVSLVQNAAIAHHPKAKYIFKLDEDIFITENYFENMLKAYKHAMEGFYRPGVMAPLIPINGYAHMRILEKLNLVDVYEEKFEKPSYMAGWSRMIESNAEVAKFFWGEGGYVPSIDVLNNRFSKEKLEERPCPIRFSIGAVLFERSLWEEMGYFNVPRGTVALGLDEEELCSYCCLHSRPLMVSENVVVGHLSFGPQNQIMREFFEKHRENFKRDTTMSQHCRKDG